MIGARTARVSYRRARMASGRLRVRGKWRGVRIFGYHRISADPGVLSVHPDDFALQMQQLASSDIRVIPLEQALDRLVDGPVEERLACITFDDGYRDVLENAVPVLDALGFAATIYVPTAIIDGASTYYWFDRPPPSLSWDELETLARGSTIDIQPHSRTHPWLPNLTLSDATDEIAGSKADLEARLGLVASSFCFPAGLAGERELELVQSSGFRAAVTTDPGVNRDATSLRALRRTLVFWDDSEATFSAKLDGALDRPSLAYRRTQRSRRSQAAPGYAKTTGDMP
jgi:peptidoglycan/xylan/chitin deacetylase (PgdA/CDA1 family)